MQVDDVTDFDSFLVVMGVNYCKLVMSLTLIHVFWSRVSTEGMPFDDTRKKLMAHMIDLTVVCVFRSTGSTEDAPFDMTRKQPKVEVIDIASR